MKIALLTPYYYPKIGGLEQYARQLALALQTNHGCEIIVITSGGRRTVVEKIDGMLVYRLAVWFKLSNTPVNPLWPFMIRRIVRRQKVDVLHAHSPVPSMADCGALAMVRTPFVLTYHAATLRKEGSLTLKLITTVYESLGKVTFWRANKVAAVSQYVKDQLPAAIQEKTVVVPNAVGRETLVSRTQPINAPRFVFIGSLDRTHAWKGVNQIITALASYKQHAKTEFYLDIIGDGSARADYEQQVADLQLQDHVIFHGALTGDAKDTVLSKATALIAYPTTGNDAFPTVFLEAWAKQVPVIAAAIGPIPSLIEHGENGYLVQPSQPALLAAEMLRVASDTASRTAVAAQAYQDVIERFTWDKQADRMMILFKELAS